MDRWNQNNDTEVPKYKYTGLCCEKMEREGENEEEMRENEEMEREYGNGERFTPYISSFSLYFLLLYPFPISKIVSFCRKMLNTALLSRMSQQT